MKWDQKTVMENKTLIRYSVGCKIKDMRSLAKCKSKEHHIWFFFSFFVQFTDKLIYHIKYLCVKMSLQICQIGLRSAPSKNCSTSAKTLICEHLWQGFLVGKKKKKPAKNLSSFLPLELVNHNSPRPISHRLRHLRLI